MHHSIAHQRTRQELSSTSSLPLLLLLLPLLVVPLLYLYLRRQDPMKQPCAHGLKVYPILGTLPHLLKNQDRFLEWYTGVMQSSPTHTLVFKVSGLAGEAITADPANVEHILRANFGNYPKGELTVSMFEDFLGHGIFNSDGEQWLWQRKAASYEFNKRSLRNFVVDVVRFEVVDRLVPLLERAARDAQTLDLQDVLERFAFDNICRVAFGQDPACLAAAEEGMAAHQSAAEFMAAFTVAQDTIVARVLSPTKWMWRVKRLLDMEPERRMRSALANIHRYSEQIVRDRREAGRARRDDLLSRFAAAGEHSDESLRDVVTNFILAGRDTTSSALTWSFWLLSTRPDVEAKIMREIRASAQGTANFSLDELRQMHYLHATITESMRLYPPVAADVHSCKEDDVLPDGTFIGKGWLMTYCAFAMARLESIWGEDCEEFRPERWLDGEGVFRPASPFKYPVFHAWPRMCLGKEMAYIQMKYIVACVLERFSLRYVGGKGHPKLVMLMTLRMGGGLPMQVKNKGG
ncbi:hypothetical protein CFC21_028960 [Triticum aestivum]|uniref:Cytochrome P450 n=3 Tax=Triticum aestivum TaxID=4565 RepID=A0A3B6D3W2_WHEAT|nr:hypothetical protein CFC21_028960 [Triticum aestivum]